MAGRPSPGWVRGALQLPNPEWRIPPYRTTLGAAAGTPTSVRLWAREVAGGVSAASYEMASQSSFVMRSVRRRW